MIHVVVISILFFFFYFGTISVVESPLFSRTGIWLALSKVRIQGIWAKLINGLDSSGKYGGNTVKGLWAGLSGCDLTRSCVSHGLCRSCGCHQW